MGVLGYNQQGTLGVVKVHSARDQASHNVEAVVKEGKALDVGTGLDPVKRLLALEVIDVDSAVSMATDDHGLEVMSNDAGDGGALLLKQGEMLKLSSS